MSEILERVAEAIDLAIERAGGWDDGFADSNMIARAAIEAMRKPTDAMIKAHDDYPFMPEAWNAMIDAALDKVDA